MSTIWIKAALVRAIKTMATTAAALIGTNGTGITEVDWIAVSADLITKGSSYEH